eukprot:1954562-Amphidinium_carterae.1
MEHPSLHTCVIVYQICDCTELKSKHQISLQGDLGMDKADKDTQGKPDLFLTFVACHQYSSCHTPAGSREGSLW